MDKLSEYIRNIPDFPKKGIIYRDITTLLKDYKAFHKAVELITQYYQKSKIDKVVCIESRGFITGAVLAMNLGAGFVPIRKEGKLPSEVFTQEYDLEYGSDSMQIHRDAITKGERILLHDDLLATGGTICAAIKLLDNFQAHIVGLSFLIELAFLKGREKLDGYDIFALIKYNKE